MKQQRIRRLVGAIAIIIAIAILLTSCTDNQRARQFGGTETIELPKGQRLVNATWKEVDLWILTEPMPDGYVPQTKTFQEKSSMGLVEGTVIFKESR